MSGDAFRWPVRVYYEDTDAGGVVFHASYVRYFERARTEWLRARGIEQSRLAAERDLLFAIAGMELSFRMPARLDDELVATCELARRGGASMRFEQQILRPRDGALIATAGVRAACLAASTFRPCAMPQDLSL